MQETWETWIWSLGRENPLEENMATYSSILAWRIPWTEEPGRLQFIGSQRIRHNWSNLAQTAHFNKNPSPWSLPSIQVLSQFWLISYRSLYSAGSSHADLLLICFFSVLEPLHLLFPGDGTHHPRFAHDVFCSFTPQLKSCCSTAA